MFSIFTFFNLNEQLKDWLGLASLSFAAIYLGTYLLLLFRDIGTVIFSQTVLIIALGFSLLALPAQLQGVYNQMAWLAVAAACLYFGNLIHNKFAYVIGLFIIVLTCLSIKIETHPQPLFN
jgi:hypothetical protein